MNKAKINELIEQATVRHEVYLPGDDGHPTPTFYFSQEKFAELIIKETLSGLKERIATRYQGSEKDRDIGYGMEIVYFDIVDKFGVEE